FGAAWLVFSRLSAVIDVRWSPVRTAATAAGFTATILAAQFLFVLLYQRCVVHLGPIQSVAGLLQPLVALMGLVGSAEHGILYVETHNRILPFSVTSEKLGLMIAGSLLSAVLAFPPRGPVRSKLRILGLLTSAVVVYVLIRFCVLILLFREYNILSLYWNPV